MFQSIKNTHILLAAVLVPFFSTKAYAEGFQLVKSEPQHTSAYLVNETRKSYQWVSADCLRQNGLSATLVDDYKYFDPKVGLYKKWNVTRSDGQTFDVWRTCAEVVRVLKGQSSSPTTPTNQQINLQLRIIETSTQKEVMPFSKGGTLTLPAGSYLFQLKSSAAVSRMRMQALNSECSIGKQADFFGGRFTVGEFKASTTTGRCNLKFNAWHDNWNWAADLDHAVTFNTNDDSGSDPHSPDPVDGGLVDLKFRVLDPVTQSQVRAYSGASSISLPNGRYIFEVKSNSPVKRMRMSADNSNCQIERLPDLFSSDGFAIGRFTTGTNNQTCNILFDTWHDNWKWAGRLKPIITFSGGSDDGYRSLPDPEDDVSDSTPTDPSLAKYALTVGSGRSSEMDTSSRSGSGNAHGTRIYCPISHFSYDDPIVFPNQPGKAHLHMFWGNTNADAFSTGGSLRNNGTSSCEGGTNNRSSYWTPALFNDQNEAVIPESVVVYYKSFISGDRSKIRVIPNGLQMLAHRRVKGSRADRFRVESRTTANGKQITKLSVYFPECVQVKDGRPVLSSPNNTDHLAYRGGNCPSSHPYLIPEVSYQVNYDIPFNSNWKIASDHAGASKGSSLHADYIAAWDNESMRKVRQCVVEEKKECQFNHNGILRAQLPERFFSPSGARVYDASGKLNSQTDRTPFGKTLTPMRK